MTTGKSQMVYEYIEKKILLEEWTSGEKIPSEAQLCKTLGVSRVSVRAGIEKMLSIGLLQKKKYGATYVSNPNNDNYLRALTPTLIHNINYVEMLEIRQALDVLAIELCMENINQDILDHLKLLLEEMKTYKQEESFFEFDKKFHMTITKFSFNKLLHYIGEIMWDVLEKSAKQQYHSIGNEQRIVEHTQILDAMIHNDKELAKIYSIRHLKRTINDVKK